MNRRIRATVLGSLCLLLILFAEPTAAQPGSSAISVFPPAPRSLRQNLVRAKKAIDEGRFSDAVAEIGIVLTGKNSELPNADEGQDYFIESSANDGTQTSVKTEAQKLLGTLPPQGRELFELQFGADARALFDEAVANSDVNQLNEVVRQYFHTRAGYDAAVLLGRLHLDHGRPLAAALCLQRVAQVPSAAAKYQPELSLLLAACWQLANHPEQAQMTLASLPPRLPRGTIRLGDSDVTELPTPARAVELLTEHFRGVRLDEAQAGDWPLHRGNPARNASRPGGIPLRRSRWQVPLVADAHDQTLIEELRTGFIEQGNAMLPVVQPLAVGNTILLRSAERLIGINFETGKRIWTYPFWDSPEEEESRPSLAGLPPQSERDGRLNQLRERLWQDVPYGQVSSDGQSVYLLETHKQSPSEINPRARWNRARGIGFPMEAMQLENELVALDLQREGYILWKVGGDNGGDEPDLAGVFFLGPPLPLFGHLYLIAEIKGEIRLVVLDAATGKQQWSQQLAHMEAMFGVDEHARRYAGATPSFADGVLVCPTSAGAVVAVDVATRTLLWGYQYTSRDREPFGRGGLAPLSIQASLPMNRWQDASVTIAEGTAILTPAESDILVCLDLVTGKPRWSPLPRAGELADMLYVAGVHEGAAILVGRNRVTAISLKNGKPIWKESLKLNGSDNEMPSGRGFLSDHFYYLPTTSSQLIKIDLRKGTVVERTTTDHPLGNVICFRNEIISVAPDRAATFYQIEPLRLTVLERLKKTPQDAWALARQGELLVHDGKISEALDVLRRAYRADSRDEGVRSLLVDTYLNALGENFAAHSGLASEIDPLIDSDVRRARYLMLVALGHQKGGNLAAAADHFASLVRLTLDSSRKASSADDPFGMVTPEKDWSVRSDRFLSSRLAELRQATDANVQKTVDSFIREIVEAAKTGSTAEIRRTLQICGAHPAADPLRMQFADKLIAGGELLEAESVLMPFVERNESEMAAPAVALMAKLYDQANKPRLAAAAYQRLQKEWGKEVVWDGKTGEQLFAAAAAKTPNRLTPADTEWPWGLTSVTEAHEAARLSMYAAPQPGFPIVQRRGDALSGLKLVFDIGRTSTFLRDAHGGVVLRLPPMESRPRSEPGLWQTAADGHLLITCFAGHMWAANTLNPRPNESDVILWREAVLAGESESIKVMSREYRNPFDATPLHISRFSDQLNRPLGAIGPLSASGVVFQKVRGISCVDPRTGSTLWTRNDFEQGCDLFGDHEFVFVQPPSAQHATDQQIVECTVLSARDGRTLGKCRVPRPDQRWITQGRNILAWDQVADKPNDTRLYLYDAERQSEIWSETFPKGSRGCIVDYEEVVILQPDGRLVIRSLSDPKKLIESKLEPASNLHSIRALASADQLWLVVNDTEPEAEIESWRRRQFIQADGKIYAVDRASGKEMWQSPAIVRGFGLLPDQPSELPTLWFVRYRPTSSTQFGPTSNARIDVLCLDRRTGAAIFAKKDVPSSLTHTEVSADQRKKEVTLALPQAQFTVRFTDDPRPPAAPFQQMRDGNSVDAAFQKLGDLMESVKDVFAPAGGADPFK